MKTFAAFIFCFCISVACFAQVMFQKTYGTNSTETLSDMEPTLDGYIFCGFTNYFGHNDIYLVRVNTNGDTLWTKTFGDSVTNEDASSIQQTADSGLIFAGALNGQALLAKADAGGNILWSKLFDTGFYPLDVTCVLQTRDGGYIIVGLNNREPVIIRTDNNGDTLWTKKYSDGYGFSYASNILENSDSSFVFCCNSLGPVADASVVVKIDSSGNIIWANLFGPFDGNKIRHTNDGGYIIAGWHHIFKVSWDAALVKLNDLGIAQWENYYYGVYYGKDVQQTSDSGYILSGILGGNGVFLLKADSIGNLIWEKEYIGIRNECYVCLSQDGGYFFGGNFTSGSQEYCLMKTDSAGSGCNATMSTATVQSFSGSSVDSFTLSIPSMVVSNVSIPVLSPPTQTNILCYTMAAEIYSSENSAILFPNPAENTFTIKLNAEVNNSRAEIFNMFGEIVYSTAITNKQQTITQKFPSGIYIVKVTDGEKQFIKRLIVQ